MLLGELHRVDGAVPAPAGVDPPAHRALLPEQALLLGGFGGALGVDRDRVPVRDGRVVLHHRHRLFGRFACVALGNVGLLAGHEAHDVVDLADALRPPAGRHPHALGHRVDAARVDRVDHRVVGAVELDDRKGERAVERVLLGGLGHPGPVLDRARRPDLDEVGCELLAGGRIPLEWGSEDLVAVADAEDLASDQCGHERAEHGSERALVRELDAVLDQPRHGSTPQSVDAAAGLPGGRRKSRGSGAGPVTSSRSSVRVAWAITRSSRAVTTSTRTRASGPEMSASPVAAGVGGFVDDGTHPRERGDGPGADLGAVLADPAGEDDGVEAAERADHRSDPRDQPMDEDVDREPGALVTAVTRRDHLSQVGAHARESEHAGAPLEHVVELVDRRAVPEQVEQQPGVDRTRRGSPSRARRAA